MIVLLYVRERSHRLHHDGGTDWRQCYGFDHPDVARSLHDLSELYSTLGKYDLAEELGNRALRIPKSKTNTRYILFGILLPNRTAFSALTSQK